MKRSAVLTFLLLLSFVLISSLNVKLVDAESRTIVVPDDYSSIQEAVDAAEVGDAVFVKSETYYEHLNITKSLTLIGEDRATTIIDGGKTGAVINITHDWVNISGFTIKNSGGEADFGEASILLNNVNYCNVSGNRIDGSRHGIMVMGSSRNIIENNTLVSNRVGIYVITGAWSANSNNNNVTGNTIYSNSWGISVYRENNNTFSYNDLNGNQYGIVLDESHMHNFVGNNIIGSKIGITLNYANDNTFYQNNIINNIKDVNDIHFLDQADLTPLSKNNWDNGSIGNYWSNYTGEDSNGDGIGDTPHIIHKNTQDNYPLMKQYIIPEFPSWTIVVLLIVALMLVTVAYRKTLIR